MTLKTVHLVNIQSHKDNVFEFPETGIIRFSGNNSAGKSAVFKPLMYLLYGKLSKPDTRAGLITRTCSFGEASYKRYDEVELVIHIAREAAGTWVSISKPGISPVKRYIADKNYRELAYAFAMHYNDKRGISINYAAGDGPILFFTTPHCANGDMISMACTDGPSMTALQSLEFTLSQAHEIREKAINSIPTLEETIGAIVTYDEKELSNRQAQLVQYYNILSNIYIPTIPEIKAVPKVHTVNIHTPTLPVVKYPKIIDIRCVIADISREARDLKEVKEGKCPTCGKRLTDVS